MAKSLFAPDTRSWHPVLHHCGGGPLPRPADYGRGALRSGRPNRRHRARIVSDQMARTLGQPVVVDNVTGDSGMTAVMKVLRSAPDGYTLLMGHMGTHGAAPALANAQYDPIVSTPERFCSGWPE